MGYRLSFDEIETFAREYIGRLPNVALPLGRRYVLGPEGARGNSEELGFIQFLKRELNGKEKETR